MVKKIGFISCVKKKRNEPQPAEYLYTSPLFVKARAYALRCYDHWYILSSKYGLLDPSTAVAPYNETLIQKPAAERRRWALQAFKQISSVVPPPSDCQLFFHAGIYYRKVLVGLLQDAGYFCKAPLSGLRIGQQLSWYKRYAKAGTCNSQEN